MGQLTEWSDVFEWLWDLTEWKLSKVGHDWLLGELHELLLGLETKRNRLESVLRYQIWRHHHFVWITKYQLVTYPESLVVVVFRSLLVKVLAVWKTARYKKEG